MHGRDDLFYRCGTPCKAMGHSRSCEGSKRLFWYGAKNRLVAIKNQQVSTLYQHRPIGSFATEMTHTRLAFWVEAAYTEEATLRQDRSFQHWLVRITVQALNYEESFFGLT